MLKAQVCFNDLVGVNGDVRRVSEVDAVSQ
jgi:hypothetical protein